MAQAVFCLAQSETQTITIVDQLKAEGFSANDMSVLFSDTTGTKDFAPEQHTKAPEGAAACAGTGAVLGGTFGWLIGIGALAIPGLGPFIAAGPTMAALSGATAGGTLGGITGALVGLGIPEYEAKQYEGKISRLVDDLAEPTSIRGHQETVQHAMKQAGLVLRRPQHQISHSHPDYPSKQRCGKTPAIIEAPVRCFWYADAFKRSRLPTLRAIWSP